MKIEYDPQADALYIQLREGKIAETVETSKYIYTDVDEEGRPLGIEILFVKRHLAPEDVTSVTFNLLGVAQEVTPVVHDKQATYNTQTKHRHASGRMNARKMMNFLIPAFKQVSVEEFVEFWAFRYRQTKYPEDQYRENIEVENLEEENLKRLFEWKLGREIEKTAPNFRQAFDKVRARIEILNDFKHYRLSEEDFLQFLSGEITVGPVYRPFFFHICRPLEFALFDQHVHRSWQFLVHLEFGEKVPDDFEVYKQYNKFFSEWAQKLDTTDQWEARRRLDKALMAFGQFIQRNAVILQSEEIAL